MDDRLNIVIDSNLKSRAARVAKSSKIGLSEFVRRALLEKLARDETSEELGQYQQLATTTSPLL